MTRYTLFRVVLAIHLFDVGLVTAARYALPRKYTAPYRDCYIAWKYRKFYAATLAVLHNNFVLHNFSAGGAKIGDTIILRRPQRMVA
jgi:hypothetical protein